MSAVDERRSWEVPSQEADSGKGWRVFAATMLVAAAATNTLYGISALAKDDYFSADELLFGDMSTWGIVYIVFSVAQIIAAVMILGGRAFGAILGIAFALLSGIVVLLSIGAYPLWSVILLVIDGLIIYGLTVHGFVED